MKSPRIGSIKGVVRLPATFAGLLVVACGQRETSPVRRTPADAPAPVRAPDASRPRELGKYESIKARFEADCPSDLPEEIGAMPSLYISSTDRSCRRPFSETGRNDVARYVEVMHPDANVSYGRVDVEISRVTIGYFGSKKLPLPASCNLAIDEVVAYLGDLTGASDEQRRRVAALMRARATDISRVHLMDRTACVWTGQRSNECYADVGACDLAPGTSIVDVDLAAVELPVPVAPATR